MALQSVWRSRVPGGRIKSCLAIAAIAAFALLLGGTATAATTTVDCGSDPAALAAALATASDGDTLAITGTCTGTFEVAHTLTLTGAGGAILDGEGAGNVLTVDPGTTVVVSGLTLTDGAARLGAGLRNLGATLRVSNSTISGNTVSFGGGAGIENAEGGMMTLTNSTVSGNSTGINSDGRNHQ
jgi:nitrous oxidase accessory protein NosD